MNSLTCLGMASVFSLNPVSKLFLISDSFFCYNYNGNPSLQSNFSITGLISFFNFLNNSSLALDLISGHQDYLALFLTLKSKVVFLNINYDKSFQKFFLTTGRDLLLGQLNNFVDLKLF